MVITVASEFEVFNSGKSMTSSSPVFIFAATVKCDPSSLKTTILSLALPPMSLTLKLSWSITTSFSTVNPVLQVIMPVSTGPIACPAVGIAIMAARLATTMTRLRLRPSLTGRRRAPPFGRLASAHLGSCAIGIFHHLVSLAPFGICQVKTPPFRYLGYTLYK